LPKIAVSSQVAEGIRVFPEGNCLSTIHNGIDKTEYYPSVCETHRNGFGTIYSSHPAKDPNTILGVLKKLKKELPDIPQYVFGTVARPRGIPKSNYKRCPSVEEARHRYSRSIVWILASRSEGFPAPILEAMACGCAVVATDCGGPRDIITDGENGFLVGVGNVEQIVNKVKLLLNDIDLRRRFVDRSEETIRKFEWKSSIDKLEAVLKSLNGVGLQCPEDFTMSRKQL
jgi:glycosyltransferase involved in cell wall biosynthesis